MENKKEKKHNNKIIPIYKKIYYALAKPSKYVELTKEGLLHSARYLIIIVAIFTLIMTILNTIKVDKIMKDFINYLDSNISEITLKNLELSSPEEIKLNSKGVNSLFGCYIIVNTNITNEQANTEYVEKIKEDEKVIILLKDELITVNLEQENNTYKYTDVLNKYVKDSEREYTKQDLLDYFSRYSLSNYFVENFGYLYISYIITFILYIIILSLLGYITKLILKLKLEKFEIFSIVIYSSTLSILIYFIYSIINYFIGFILQYFGVVYMIIAYIYILISMKKMKNLNSENNESSEN